MSDNNQNSIDKLNDLWTLRFDILVAVDVEVAADVVVVDACRISNATGEGPTGAARETMLKERHVSKKKLVLRMADFLLKNEGVSKRMAGRSDWKQRM